jgi:hypothetical protein
MTENPGSALAPDGRTRLTGHFSAIQAIDATRL